MYIYVYIFVQKKGKNGVKKRGSVYADLGFEFFHIYVYVYICIYIYMYMYMYIYVYICICMTKLSYRLFDIHLPAVNTTARF